MKLLTKFTALAVAAFVVLGGAFLTTPQALATPCTSGPNCMQNGLNSVNSGSKTDVGGLIKSIVNAMLFLLGAVAVVMIVVGGIRYTTSNGDSSQISGAKNTIMYAVIGLIIAILAYAIVNFVVKQIGA